MSVQTMQAPELELAKKPFFVLYKGKKSKPELIGRALRSLAMVLRVGETEANALEIVGQQFKKYEIGRAFLDAEDIMRNQGGSFKQALLAQEVLPRTAKEMIDAAATSTALHRNLARAAKLVGDAVNVRKKLGMQMIGPGFMIGLITVFLFLSVTFIIPSFVGMFGQLGAETPMMTLILLQVAEVLKWVVGILLFVVVVAVVFWLLIGRRNPKIRAMVDRVMLKIPGLGSILQLSSTSRMFHLLASSLESGQGEAESLKSAVRGCGNDAIRAHGEDHAQRMVDEGVSMRDVMDSKLFPIAAQKMMLAAPSITQQIQIMKELAGEYDEEAELQLEKLSRTMEPTVNYIVYGIAGLLIIMVMMPMYSIYPAMMDLDGTSTNNMPTQPMVPVQ
ncbi:type II secretion system F family protein (plasmid) [Citricoccus nitrophenolicus]